MNKLSTTLFNSIRTSYLTRSSPLSSRTISSRSYSTAPAPAASSLTEGEQVLKSKLETTLKDAKVEVQDVSGGCGSFYAITIEHEAFKGLSTIKQHRLVNELLQDEIKGMHGLQLKTSAPSTQ